MIKLNDTILDLGMGSLVETFRDGHTFTIVAYGWKSHTDEKGVTFDILVLATEDGELYATRSGGLVNQFRRMEEKGLVDILTVKLEAKELTDPKYPKGATTWVFRGVYVPVQEGQK